MNSKHIVWYKDENRLLQAALVLVLATLVIINAAYVIRHTSDTKAVQADAVVLSQPHILHSTETARTPAVVASISKPSESAKPDPAFTLADGETLLAMTLSIINRTTVSQQFIPTSVLYVRTGQGDYRMLHPSVYVTKQIFSGTLKPGQTVSGQISFSVPSNETNPLLYVDTGWNNEVPIVFAPLK